MPLTRCWLSLRDFAKNVSSLGFTSSITAVSPVSRFTTVYTPVCSMYIWPTMMFWIAVLPCGLHQQASHFVLS